MPASAKSKAKHKARWPGQCHYQQQQAVFVRILKKCKSIRWMNQECNNSTNQLEQSIRPLLHAPSLSLSLSLSNNLPKTQFRNMKRLNSDATEDWSPECDSHCQSAIASQFKVRRRRKDLPPTLSTPSSNSRTNVSVSNASISTLRPELLISLLCTPRITATSPLLSVLIHSVMNHFTGVPPG